MYVKMNEKSKLSLFEFVVWLSWSAWSVCNVTCGGGGISKRSRECNDTSGGCEGESEEIESCGESNCPGKW